MDRFFANVLIGPQGRDRRSVGAGVVWSGVGAFMAARVALFPR